MGKAFVAKLAQEGARDPEALAAWIGRKKHGLRPFAKLSAKSRKGGGSSSSSPQKPADSPAPAAERASRPPRVDLAVEQMQYALSNFVHDGSLSHVTASRWHRLLKIADELRQRDPAEFSEEETQALSDFRRIVSEARKKRRGFSGSTWLRG